MGCVLTLEQYLLSARFIKSCQYSFCSLNLKEDEKVPQKSKSKLHVYPEITTNLMPENASDKAKTNKTKKKEEADKPIYLTRI